MDVERDHTKEILAGSVRSLARLITWLENGDERAEPILRELYPFSGRAFTIGITGTHGSGKSTLTDRLISCIRKEGLTVGVVAVDPSSPFTGGALLGDRIRMTEHSRDPGVYIRSMATRGALGGLAKATADAVRTLDASGRNVILIETVGAGQDEIDVVRLVDTTCVVLVPGLGDAIQVMKAGLMEIADIFVINKADRQGADQLNCEVCARIEMDCQLETRRWSPRIVKTVAVENAGVDELWSAIKYHRCFLESSGELAGKRKRRIWREVLRRAHEELFDMLCERIQADDQREKMVRDILEHKGDPYSVSHELVKSLLVFLLKAESEKGTPSVSSKL